MNAPRWMCIVGTALLACGGRVSAQEASNTGSDAPPLPPAQDVLARMRAAFPTAPLLVRGQLLCRDAEGNVARTLNADLRLEWGAHPPRAQVAVTDAFGAHLAGVSIRRPPGGAPEVEVFTNDPPVRVERPDLDAAIAGTDFTWSDLTLSFLWWPGGRTYATEMKKTRLCYVVDLPAPAGSGPCARMRLWVDSHENALLQADAFDASGRTIRRLAVKSLKKIGDTWTLEDLDLETLPARTRTTLRVLDSRLEAPDAPTAAAGPPAPEVPPVTPIPPAP